MIVINSKSHENGINVKYFYPSQISNDNMINIQNFDENTNVDYDELKMINMFDQMNKNYANYKIINKQNSKIFEQMIEKNKVINKNTSQPSSSKNPYNNTIKECLKTQNNKELSKLLLSSSSASMTKKNLQK